VSPDPRLAPIPSRCRGRAAAVPVVIPAGGRHRARRAGVAAVAVGSGVGGPQLLLVDDLDRAAPEAVAELRRLASGLPSGAIAVLVTSTRDLGLASQLTLAGPTEAELAELVPEPSADVVHALARDHGSSHASKSGQGGRRWSSANQRPSQFVSVTEPIC
jgi:hypothetical protein